VAAYAKAYEEMYGEKVYAGLVVRFEKKEPTFEAQRVDQDCLLGAFSVFEKILHLWNVTHPDSDVNFFCKK